jgi:hypothetical protein
MTNTPFEAVGCGTAFYLAILLFVYTDELIHFVKSRFFSTKSEQKEDQDALHTSD